jgi:glycosyltransferase involved in cell wall biosynthesis
MAETGQRIRLVHITTVPQTFVFLSGQMKYLGNQGFEVHTVSSPGGPDTPLVDHAVAQSHTVPMSRSITPAEDFLALWRLVRLIRKLGPHIVHSHTPKAGLLGTLAARATGVQVVFLSVFGLAQMTKAGPLRWLLDSMTRLSCFLAHRVWCDSFSMRKYLIEAKLCAPEKIVVFGQGSVRGVDARNTFSPQIHGRITCQAVRAEQGIPDDAFVLGFVGRIVGDKGMRELASAWRTLREDYTDLHLLMLGNFESKDPLLPEDEEMFRSDTRVHLAGYQMEVAPYMSAMDLFVMPSYREGFGMTNIEAAAMGLAVVSTQIPGCVDSVIDGITGTLVPPHDAKALTDAIRLYLDNPDLRSKHGLAGRERVLREFRPEAIWKATCEEYLRLLRKTQ